jgi:hypothetical protein
MFWTIEDRNVMRADGVLVVTCASEEDAQRVLATMEASVLRLAAGMAGSGPNHADPTGYNIDPEDTSGVEAEPDQDDILSPAEQDAPMTAAAVGGPWGDPKNKKYPLRSEEEVRAAWAYINVPRNAAKYPLNGVTVTEVKARIKTAAKKYGIQISA